MSIIVGGGFSGGPSSSALLRRLLLFLRVCSVVSGLHPRTHMLGYTLAPVAFSGLYIARAHVA